MHPLDRRGILGTGATGTTKPSTAVPAFAFPQESRNLDPTANIDGVDKRE